MRAIPVQCSIKNENSSSLNNVKLDFKDKDKWPTPSKLGRILLGGLINNVTGVKVVGGIEESKILLEKENNPISLSKGLLKQVRYINASLSPSKNG